MIRRVVIVFLVYILGIFILFRLVNIFHIIFFSICFFIYMIWELFNYYNGDWKKNNEILFANLQEGIDIAKLKKSHRDLFFLGWRVDLLVMKVFILMIITYILLLKIERQ